MKYFLNISFVLLVLMTGSISNAQWYGVKGGYNLSSIVYYDNNGKQIDLFSNNPGFHIGLVTEFPVYKRLSLEPSLLFSTKGYKENYDKSSNGDLLKFNTAANFNYLDIPLTAKSYLNLRSAKIFGTIGPYLGIGLGGEIKKTTTSTNSGQSSTDYTDIKWGPELGQDNFKRIDLGLIAGAGVEFRSVQLGISYNYGLRNISERSEDGYKVNNRVLGFSMSLKFDYGNLKSSDSKSRLKAVKRIRSQNKLLHVAVNDIDWTVRCAAFDKLNNNSLNEICKGKYDPALQIASKIRLNLTTWNEEFDNAASSSGALGDVIGAAALVNSPKPAANDVVLACHKYIEEGNATRIPELINLLNRFGDKALGEDYMNCGNIELANAGESWGRAHGYNIGTGNGSHRVRWGEKK
jgi:hypothetical protein